MLQRATFNIAENLLKMLLSYSCESCLDTSLRIERNAVGHCPCGAQPNAAATKLYLKIGERQDTGKFINVNVIQTARALVRATPELLVSLTALCQHLNITDRGVKSCIEAARNEWLLPIGSSRDFPTGYYWITTPEQMKGWMRQFLAQPYKELQTVHRVVNANFPELAGQIALPITEEQ